MPQKKLYNFFLLLILTSLWTCFFWLFKYFFWSVWKDILWITLEEIAGYLAIGWLIAYIFWSLLYEILKEKFSLILIALWVTLSLIFWLWSSLWEKYMISLLTICCWFFYGYWGVIKNIIISQEIEYTWKSDTFINGFANIAFFVFLIVWSIGWGLLFENFWLKWVYCIVWLALFAGGLSLWVRQDKKVNFREIKRLWKSYLANYVPNFITVIKANFLIMLICSLYLVIATILSQKAIAFSVDHLGKTNSQASTLLLYSAVWTIFGNFISMKIPDQKRWLFWSLFSCIFAVLIFVFPYLMQNFIITALLAGLAGLFFWINYNLCESYFLLKIGKQWKREYWASSYGIIASLCIAGLMFLTHSLETFMGFEAVFILWGIVVLIISSILYTGGKSL